VSCPTCGHTNPAGNRFCGSCGAALAASCAACGHSNPPDHRFCGACGAALALGKSASPVTAPPAPERSPRAYTPRHLADKILASRAALEGERKQVTVLFADVKGSMELAESVDPEQWHAILDRFFAILADGVHRFEGTVNQYTGDGIMALFGAPLAHEDHAQRACYAALHLRDALRAYADELRRTRGLSLSTRIGLNSGEVVVGKIGDDLRMDYTAQGHTVGLAQRMEQLSAADSTYLTAHTARLVEGYFQLRDLGDFELKGVNTPLRVHELQGVGALRTRFDRSRQRGLTRFVGRSAEIATLNAALERAVAGQGSVVGIAADAGTGKSRLCFEFVERCRARGMTTLTVSALAHTRAVPYVTVLDCFRRWFGIEDRDTPRMARDKIAGRLLLLDEALRNELPVVFDFLGVADPERPSPPIEAEVRQRRLLEVQRRLVRGAREPEVWLIEDLHWLDEASEAFVADWADAVRDARGLLLVNYRPQYRAPWLRKAHELPLAALGAAATRELLTVLLGADASLAELAALIEGRVGGNPFFAEEFVRSLAESERIAGTPGAYRLVAPIGSIAVPAGVEAVLAARIDRLGEREKHVIQAAAVIGREFSRPVLERVVDLEAGALDAALGALRETELIFEQSLYPVARYTFKHALVQDVAGGALLRERRKRLHGATARAIEATADTSASEIAMLVASHFEAAGELLGAAERYAAAARVMMVHDSARALALWRKVRDLADASPSDAGAVELRLEARECILNAWMAQPSDEETDEAYRRGREIAESLGDLRAIARLGNPYGIVLRARGEVEACNALQREALGYAERAGDPFVRARSLNILSASLAYQGPLSEALAHRDASLAVFAMTPGLETDPFNLGSGAGSFARANRGYLLGLIGDFDRAYHALGEALRAASAGGHGVSLIWVHDAYVSTHWLAGRRAEIAMHVREMARVQRESLASDNPYLVLAEAFGELASDRHREAMARATRGRSVFSQMVLALAWLGLGDPGAAANAAREGLGVVRARGYRVVEAWNCVVLARALRLAQGRAVAAEITSTLDAAEDAIRFSGARAYSPQVMEERARLAALLDGAERADRELRAAHAQYAAIGATGHAARLAKELGL
jgi:class 3 adenylate cyclase